MASARLEVGGGVRSLLKEGYKEMSGLELAILKNIEACRNLGKMTRTSMGPNGMNKLLVNHLDKLFVTSNAGTILGELEVVHPAAKMVVMAAKSQEEEFGDYTNFVLTFATELLNQAEELLQVGVHAADILSGYTKATSVVLDAFPSVVCHEIKDLRDEEELLRATKSVVAAKQYGYEDLICKLVAKACLTVMPLSPKKPSINMDHVRVAKMLGGNIHQSVVLNGMVIRRAPESSRTKVENAKVAVFATSVEAAQTETKGTVKLSSAEELLQYNKTEEALLESQIEAIRDSGVDVVVSGGSISEMALHFIDKYGMMAVKITSKFELKRVCRTVGAIPLVRVGAVLAEELGHCDKVYVKEISGSKCTMFEQGPESDQSAVATVVLHGATQSLLDDLERAVTVGVNCVKTLCEDSRLIYGGGCADTLLSQQVRNYGAKCEGMEQYSVVKYAEALENSVPAVLSENCGKDAAEVVSNLHAAHNRGETSFGIDVDSGELCCMKEKSIYDTYAAKLQAVRLASDVALTILRVDQLIMSKQAGGPKLPPQA